MRSWLFIPGNSERKLEKGFASAADAVIVDLEDSVAAHAKAEARRVAATFLLERHAARSVKIYIRVNDFASGQMEDDLAALMPTRPDGIILPKACGAADVERLSARLRVHEAKHGQPDGATRIVPIITETAAGLFAMPSFRPNLPRLEALTWGAEDLSAAIGAQVTHDETGNYTEVFRLARSLTLLAASAAEVTAIDTVFVDFRDDDGLRDACVAAERDGFGGKLAIHPAQVDIINAVFTPSPEAVAQASMLVAAFAAAGNPGVLGIDGKMYDRPHLRRAERLLSRVV